MGFQAYELSKTLSLHSQDVRGVCAISNELLASASRDGTYAIWKLENGSWTHSVYTNHDGFVNSIAYIPRSDGSLGYVATGGQDKTVILHDIQSDKADVYLLGHESNVCAIHGINENIIITGSWDATARVWALGQCTYTLRGHSSSVWAVLALDAETFVTGSADKTIRLWKNGKTVKTINAHNDCVRFLCRVPDGFASCGNDATIKIWTLDGKLLRELNGHSSFIYSLSYNATKDILVSSSEDRSIRVWKEDTCLQTITLPATSVWSVACTPKGNIVCGTSDGQIRIFTTDPSELGSSSERKAFQDQVANFAVASQQIGNIPKEQFRKADDLQRPGKKDGEVAMVRHNASVDAYQWSAAKNEWVKIGQVVDAVTNNRKQLYEGKEYDYVFDVDIEDGKPPLKLPVNVTDNPYLVAAEFLEKNRLPSTYTDQVVEFIRQNTQGMQFDVPTQNKSSTTSTASSKRPSLFPIAYYTFTEGNLEGMRKRLLVTYEKAAKPVTDTRFREFLSLLPKLKTLSEDETSLCIEASLLLLDSWSLEERFPVLDVLRLVALQPRDSYVPVLTDAFMQVLRTVSGQGKFESINRMLALRGLANLIPHMKDFGEYTSQITIVMNELCPNDTDKDEVKVAWATLIMNICTKYESDILEDLSIELLPKLITFLGRQRLNSETVYRTLMALGTLCIMPTVASAAVQVYDVPKCVKPVVSKFESESRMNVAFNELVSICKASQ
ncbi:WD repeat protein Lub1 [Schizosaccharomyces japonicus yFS275]|uniref:WD repeat protein Lub1 n=1 Tax=Schizosaccharomyces japonicus (strain yFS275 / FY16936) TaxID=402676 RepID=B6JVA5_SCHJY|nr:WD repeat protein Lub1 [Schizosaccharomyces japonicus yFS275]EEB05306.2 WD repeat protein Lub1 [Schizosaccharomyces japonicus yFS275]